jgi:hypothetical protein
MKYPFFNIFEHGFLIRIFVVRGSGARDSLVRSSKLNFTKMNRGSLNFMLFDCVISKLSVSYLVYNP